MAEDLYQKLRDAGFEEYDLEQRTGEGWTLQMMYDQAVADGYFEDEPPSGTVTGRMVSKGPPFPHQIPKDTTEPFYVGLDLSSTEDRIVKFYA